MRALILDAGNSRLNSAAWEGEGQLPGLEAGPDRQLAPPVPLFDLGALNYPNPGKVAGFKDDFRKMHEECGFPPVVLVTVVPEVIEWLPGDIDLEVVDHNSELPYDLAVSKPAQVGPDRLCNVAAAAAAGLGSALIVDAGTATTFDVLLEGSFVGGMIAPGMASAAVGLADQAARLEAVPFTPAGWEAGPDTRSAMEAGAWHTGRGGILHTVSGLLEHYGEMQVILTGGLGIHLRDSGWHFDPHWTLRGAAVLSKI